MADTGFDPLLFGQHLRHARRQAGLTLENLGARVGKPAPYLSMVENGKREPKLSLITTLAAELDIPVTALLSQEPPTRRAWLEVAVERAQEEPMYQGLNLPRVKPSTKVPDEILEHLVALYDEVKRRSQINSATPEEARMANLAIRQAAEEAGNYFEDIEAAAAKAIAGIDYTSGPLSQRDLLDIAALYGFTIHPVQDFPSAVRSVADQRAGKIYIPQRNELSTRAARSVVLRTLGHFVLGHTDPSSYGEFLHQRMEAAYFASAVLVPESAAVPFLQQAKADRDLSVGDLREIFYVAYDMAAHRFTNLATQHLGLQVHMVRSDEEGIIWKAYSNDEVPFPTDAEGAIEGQRLCRQWGTRQVFRSKEKFATHYQYTDTPGGSYWCATHVEENRDPLQAVTVGTTFDQAKYFRGRDTDLRTASKCPDGECCRRPPVELGAKWEGAAWPSPKAAGRIVAALPAGTFPGVDMSEVYEFLERNS